MARIIGGIAVSPTPAIGFAGEGSTAYSVAGQNLPDWKTGT